MYSTSDFRNGLKIEVDGIPYEIAEFLHVKPGKGGAFVRTKLKNMESGTVIDKTFRAGEKVEKADIQERAMQFLYRSGDEFHFMEMDTYGEVILSAEEIKGADKFLSEGETVTILYHGKNPIGVELPFFVNLKVIKTEPGVRGNTAAGGTKPATLSTGAVVQVPFFIEENDLIKVDTRTGEYIERTTK
ncbi:MAG: elongation factor P [Candidatus Aminicenantes bacterium]|nr:elongation factor P [Candidatus Aminicenantes bacterium]MDH5714699.1 elongation factor P [Candidatus Aminicenantes bacterium]